MFPMWAWLAILFLTTIYSPNRFMSFYCVCCTTLCHIVFNGLEWANAYSVLKFDTHIRKQCMYERSRWNAIGFRKMIVAGMRSLFSIFLERVVFPKKLSFSLSFFIYRWFLLRKNGAHVIFLYQNQSHQLADHDSPCVPLSIRLKDYKLN